ncbi:nitrite reductase/ring-hydroxylating ferredoxin subunit [Krasilnikovia cinnamomea]|uniref:Cytochrome bc1 complex Rieske iron-sulfur subunit n=1 Tax=Krasilnikovia cinnamomea TaxID=349313 RepID=A0A4Q7ZQK5_9ACTN|nr:Rieske (2Fe-2S) protein [Krasilnikovia cinnamomea]RZU53054.1 nitrite reductase/ring-hydroxylating ferredoxin subunit [Krasilnikovia cinnamomea]
MTDVQARTDIAHPQGEPTRQGAVAPRRAVLAGAGALGATCLLAACGTSGGSSGTNPNGSDFQNNPAPAGSKGADAGFPSGGDSNGGDSGNSGGATVLAAVADVPKGGGIIQGDLVITQPSEGTFKAFSKACTHAGCDVNKVNDGVISCPCHGSTFSIEDGSPKGGPANKALAETKVKVDGDNIVKA